MPQEKLTPQVASLLRYINEHCDKNFSRLSEAVEFFVEFYNNSNNK